MILYIFKYRSSIFECDKFYVHGWADNNLQLTTFKIVFLISTAVSAMSSAEDTWLEKQNFGKLLINQPEVLRTKVRKIFNELQYLKKDVQIDKDVQNDLLVRNTINPYTRCTVGSYDSIAKLIDAFGAFHNSGAAPSIRHSRQ